MSGLICPNCGKTGTADHCKDFTCLSLGEYLCRACNHKFSLFKKAPENATAEERKKIITENIRIARGLMDPCQNRAADAILCDCIPKKAKK